MSIELNSVNSSNPLLYEYNRYLNSSGGPSTSVTALSPLFVLKGIEKSWYAEVSVPVGIPAVQ